MSVLCNFTPNTQVSLGVCVFLLQGSGNVILQRAADGTPLQWFVAEDAEIVSQV